MPDGVAGIFISGLKKKAQRRQRNPSNATRFARTLFWVSWIWVLLFVVGDLLEAGSQGHGAKIVFGLVTLLAIGSGGFALEKTLRSAMAGKTHRPRIAQHRTVNARKMETETVGEGGSKEAAPVDMPAKVDDYPDAQAPAQKPGGRKRPNA